MKADRLVVEATLGQALEPFDCKLGFLDFETIMRAVPVWPGMAPWEQAPAQFSYHEANGDGTYTHAEYLAEGPKDCRPELARAMVEATKNAEKVAMYSSFEKTRIRGLQEAVPELRVELEALEGKLVDLLPVVRENVYHPDFLGSFSLKYVLHPLVPELTYDDLADDRFLERGGIGVPQVLEQVKQIDACFAHFRPASYVTSWRFVRHWSRKGRATVRLAALEGYPPQTGPSEERVAFRPRRSKGYRRATADSSRWSFVKSTVRPRHGYGETAASLGCSCCDWSG